MGPIPLRPSRLRSRIKKEFPQISRDSSSLENNSKMAELSRTTTSRKSPLSISSSDSEEECRSSSRPSPVRPSPSRLNRLTPLRLSRPRSRTRKEFPQISKDLSSPVSNSKMAVPSRTTTSRRSPLFISSLGLEEECRSSSRPSPERPSPSRLSRPIPSKLSRPRSRIKKEFPQISRDSSSLVSSSRMAELSRITTSRRSLPSISSSDLEEECKSLSRLSPVRPSLSRSSRLTASKPSRPRSRIRKEFPQISKDSSSPESNSKTAV